jgi:hypothetical protein
MHKGVLTAIVFVVGALGYAAHANADLISIGLQETGSMAAQSQPRLPAARRLRSERSAMGHSGSTRPPHKIPQGSDTCIIEFQFSQHVDRERWRSPCLGDGTRPDRPCRARQLCQYLCGQCPEQRYVGGGANLLRCRKRCLCHDDSIVFGTIHHYWHVLSRGRPRNTRRSLLRDGRIHNYGEWRGKREPHY